VTARAQLSRGPSKDANVDTDGEVEVALENFDTGDVDGGHPLKNETEGTEGEQVDQEEEEEKGCEDQYGEEVPEVEGEDFAGLDQEFDADADFDADAVFDADFDTGLGPKPKAEGEVVEGVTADGDVGFDVEATVEANTDLTGGEFDAEFPPEKSESEAEVVVLADRAQLRDPKSKKEKSSSASDVVGEESEASEAQVLSSFGTESGDD